MNASRARQKPCFKADVIPQPRVFYRYVGVPSAENLYMREVCFFAFIPFFFIFLCFCCLLPFFFFFSWFFFCHYFWFFCFFLFFRCFFRCLGLFFQFFNFYFFCIFFHLFLSYSFIHIHHFTGFCFLPILICSKEISLTFITWYFTPDIEPTAPPWLPPMPAITTLSCSATCFTAPSRGRKAVTCLPFFINLTLTHFIKPLCGCFCSTTLFSKTMP